MRGKNTPSKSQKTQEFPLASNSREDALQNLHSGIPNPSLQGSIADSFQTPCAYRRILDQILICRKAGMFTVPYSDSPRYSCFLRGCPQLCNTLPQHMRTTKSLPNFRTQLKTNLLHLTYPTQIDCRLTVWPDILDFKINGSCVIVVWCAIS